MSNKNKMKEVLIVKKMRAEDNLELPMDDLFFDQMHNKIMAAVEKTEVKPVSKWDKSWVFLDRKTQPHRAKARKAVKLSIAAVTFMFGIGLLNHSFLIYKQAQLAQNDMNQQKIIAEAKNNPIEWSELVANYQHEEDFYTEVLSQRGTETIVEIDRVLAQSL
jgi:hypothetical protein